MFLNLRFITDRLIMLVIPWTKIPFLFSDQDPTIETWHWEQVMPGESEEHQKCTRFTERSCKASKNPRYSLSLQHSHRTEFLWFDIQINSFSTLREVILAGNNFHGRKEIRKNRISQELIFLLSPYFGHISFIFLRFFQFFLWIITIFVILIFLDKTAKRISSHEN